MLEFPGDIKIRVLANLCPLKQIDYFAVDHLQSFIAGGLPLRPGYAIAHTKDGGIFREIMNWSDIEKVRNVSRAKNSGPWQNWPDEMAKKSVIRRLIKRLPVASEVRQLFDREFNEQRREPHQVSNQQELHQQDRQDHQPSSQQAPPVEATTKPQSLSEFATSDDNQQG